MKKSVVFEWRVGLALWTVFFFTACSGSRTSDRLDDVETYVEAAPDSALAVLGAIDSTALSTAALRAHYGLLYAIALDKKHIDDGRLVENMASASRWYQRHGDRQHQLRSAYYYGDQLRGAGFGEEAAVQFMIAEKEAVAQEEWFFAGMSARSLYYVFAKTHNYPEEVACITRAVDYFHKAGLESHEDDARVKQAMAYYDHSRLPEAESLFNEAIKTAEAKKDTVRWRRALAQSVDVLLIKDEPDADSTIIRLMRAQELGYRFSSRDYANLALAKAYLGDRDEVATFLRLARNTSRSKQDSVFVLSRTYRIRLWQQDTLAAFPLLQQMHTYLNEEATRTLEQSVVKAQNSFLDANNRQLEQNVRLSRTIHILLVLLLVSCLLLVWLWVMAEKQRRRIKEMEFDDFRMACNELFAMGQESIDSINQAYYAAGNNKTTAVYAAYHDIISRFKAEDFQNRFLESVDKSHGGIVTRLQQQIPSLGRDRVLLFAYLVHGFSYATISVILGDKSKSNIYNRRQRLVETIKEKTPPDMDLFLRHLPNRPTRA